MTTPSKRTILLASAVALIAMGSAGALFYANTSAQASTVELPAAAPQAMPVAAAKIEIQGSSSPGSFQHHQDPASTRLLYSGRRL